MHPAPDITQLLVRWREGDPQALEELLPLVYQELRTLARAYLRRERSDHTLQPTALVHELYVRLATQAPADVHDRTHFFGIAARAMRQLLVSHARQHRAQKRGGGESPLQYDSVTEPSVETPLDLTALDAALSALGQQDPALARIVELRFFGGYTIDETAQIAGCSPATVSRDWQLARMWLFREMGGDASDA